MTTTAFSTLARLQRPFVALWIASARLGFEAQAVIGLRVLGMATGAVPAMREAQMLVPEKLDAFAEAHYTIARATLTGRGTATAEDVVRLYRRRVRANRKRLTRMG